MKLSTVWFDNFFILYTRIKKKFGTFTTAKRAAVTVQIFCFQKDE